MHVSLYKDTIAVYLYYIYISVTLVYILYIAYYNIMVKAMPKILVNITEEMKENKKKINATWKQLIFFGIKSLTETKEENNRINSLMDEIETIKSWIQKETVKQLSTPRP